MVWGEVKEKLIGSTEIGVNDIGAQDLQHSCVGGDNTTGCFVLAHSGP